MFRTVSGVGLIAGALSTLIVLGGDPSPHVIFEASGCAVGIADAHKVARADR